MKSVTTCPSCQTQFLVTDEQLSQYNGKVRCGHCLHVFNAIDHLSLEASQSTETNEAENIAHTAVEPPDAQPDPVEPPQAEAISVEALPQSETVQILETPLTEADVDTNDSQEKQSLKSETALNSQHINEPTPETHTTNNHENGAITALSSKRADLLKELFEQANLPLEEVSAALPDRVETKIEPELGDLAEAELESTPFKEDFNKINTAGAKPEYQYYLEERKRTSPALVTFAVILGLAAILQGVFFYRHAIAMTFPESKPLLVSVCQTLGCKIDLPKEIQLFSIDDSTIEEDAQREGVIRLTSTITNRADFNQAYPNLEVTLTDTQDQPKLRRTFKPSEYLTKELHLEEGIAAGDSIAINMPLMADDLKPAGFRLLVSY